MTQVTLQGNTYSDAGESAKDMNNGGHRTHFFPLVQDVVLTAADVASDAAAAANAVDARSGTSTTSRATGTGSKTFTTQTGKSFGVGDPVIVSRTSDSNVWMSGLVTSYTSGTGVIIVNVTRSEGAGTFTDWTIKLSGAVGATGSSGVPTTTATASGALSNGSHVVLNSDGTVSVVSGIYAGNTWAAGVQFDAGGTDYIAACFDSTNNKVVVAYRDTGNSNYGTAVVGTITAGVISFGTPVVFLSAASSYHRCAFHAGQGKVVILYGDASTDLYAIAGTVSGTSITFGSAVLVNNTATVIYNPDICYHAAATAMVIVYQGASNYPQGVVATLSGTVITINTPAQITAAVATQLACCYDSALSKTVISFHESDGKAVVASVTGTTISYGSIATWETDAVASSDIAFDATSGKVVIGYTCNTGSYYAKAIVGTVSGTSISFGSAATLSSQVSGTVTEMTAAACGSSRVIFCYLSNLSGRLAVVGTVSGTSITPMTARVVTTAGWTGGQMTYDSNAARAVFPYAVTASSNAGQASVIQVGAELNLTTKQYLGVSNGAYSDTTTATIQVIGAVDDAQTGLTTGAKYYFADDGALSTTPGTLGIYAGLATAATKLLVKG